MALRCRLGFHTGQDQGGLSCFTCPRCGRTLMQDDPRYRTAMEGVRMLEAIDDRHGLAYVVQGKTADAMADRVARLSAGDVPDAVLQAAFEARYGFLEGQRDAVCASLGALP